MCHKVIPALPILGRKGSSAGLVGLSPNFDPVMETLGPIHSKLEQYKELVTYLQLYNKEAYFELIKQYCVHFHKVYAAKIKVYFAALRETVMQEKHEVLNLPVAQQKNENECVVLYCRQACRSSLNIHCK